MRSDSTSDRVSPFGYLRIKGCLPPPRSFSQAATSFIGFSCLGIHHTPLAALLPLKHENVLALSRSDLLALLDLLLTCCRLSMFPSAACSAMRRDQRQKWKTGWCGANKFAAQPPFSALVADVFNVAFEKDRLSAVATYTSNRGSVNRYS